MLKKNETFGLSVIHGGNCRADLVWDRLGNNLARLSQRISRLRGSVMGHSVYLAELSFRSSIYFIDDDTDDGMAIASLGEVPESILFR